jgi:hypothetical protein
MSRLPDPARNRIQDGLRKYTRIVAQARQRGMNHIDTGDIVKAMVGDMLGYDPFFDVTSEASVRGPHADYAVSIDHQLHFLLIIKAIGIAPHAAHLLRLSGANVPAYVEWVVATNADIWACYRLGVGKDRHPELVFRISLLDNRPIEEKLNLFSMLSKEGVQQGALVGHWEQNRALNAGRIASLVLSDEVLNVLRRELHRDTHYRVDNQSLRELLVREVLRPEACAAQQPGNLIPRQPHCYAYVANPNDSATWKLYYRNADGTPDPERLIIAAAQLDEDSKHLHIPADDLPLVKERLRQAYLELGVPAEDLPASLSI